MSMSLPGLRASTSGVVGDTVFEDDIDYKIQVCMHNSSLCDSFRLTLVVHLSSERTCPFTSLPCQSFPLSICTSPVPQRKHDSLSSTTICDNMQRSEVVIM